jgi:hypothetical protein
MQQAAKKRAKAHAELNKIKDEPTIRAENYNVDIGTAMVWYTEPQQTIRNVSSTQSSILPN